MTVADLVVGQLLGAGVRTLFGVPGGGGNLDLIAAAGRIGLRFVLMTTETAGAIAAMAQAEITGRPGACLTTLGPGAASVVNGAACAFLDRAPLVVFTDTQPAVFEHQRLDHGALLASVTKRSATLAADTALQTIREGLHAATTGRPGPVHLDCPSGVAGSMPPLVDASCVQFEERMPSPDARSKFQALLAEAHKPLLLVGLGARKRSDAVAIRSLCARRNIPAMVTYKAKGVVADDHPWFAGVFTNAMIEQRMIDECDLLIGMGLDPVELLPRAWTHGQPIVYCGPWPIDDAHMPFAAQLVTDVASAAREIEALLPSCRWDRGLVRRLLDEQRRQIDVPAGGLSSQRVVQIGAARLASAVGHVTVDAGAHMFPATVLWPVSDPNGMLISNGLSTMGFAMPAAIGAALLDPARPVVALTGDGGLLMCVGELMTAAREKLRIITIVFSDASLSLIEIKQQARGLDPAGVALGAIDWQALARSFGVRSWGATTEAELDRAAGEALACDGPTLIEAKIDRSNYGATVRAVRG
jgi:acetolactate synthase I/II/III large subunit